MHPLIKAELENLQLQFGNKSMLTLDDYAELYGIQRRCASNHLRRRGIPASKEGKSLYISILDLAKYKAQRKIGNEASLLLGGPITQEDMKNRRGFNQLAMRRQLGK